MQKSIIAYLLGAAHLTAAVSDTQRVLAPIPDWTVSPPHGDHSVHESILAAIENNPDPVAALISLQSEDVRAETEATLAEPRLLRMMGEAKPEWMTEGDKMRFRRLGIKFMDITDHEKFYAEQIHAMAAAKPSELPSYGVILAIINTSTRQIRPNCSMSDLFDLSSRT